jgi:hypothetical protein
MNADDLVKGWKSHFWAADHAIDWKDSERKCTVWLSDSTLLVGIIDAMGFNGEGKLFFGEWKTANPRERNTWKSVWRLNPQSLSYGVLIQNDPAIRPDCSTFTVRKAFKEKNGVPTFDHAWFAYSPEELRHWRGELLRIADEIRAYRAAGAAPWPTNFTNCFKFGLAYACPFFEHGCSKQNWSHTPTGAGVKMEQEWVANAIAEVPFKRDLVVLSPSRVADWLSCRELFRRKVVDLVELPATSALEIGKDFHEQLSDYYRTLINMRKAGVSEPLQQFFEQVHHTGGND